MSEVKLTRELEGLFFFFFAPVESQLRREKCGIDDCYKEYGTRLGKIIT